MPHSLPHMPHSPPKPAHVHPWAGLSPLAAKRRRLDGFDAEGLGRRNDEHAAAPASSLATRFRRADSSTAEDQDHGGKDVAAPAPTSAPPLPPKAFAPPAPTPAPEGHSLRNDDHAAAPASSLATRFRRADSSAAEDQNHGSKDVAAPAPTPAPPLLPMAFAPPAPTVPAPTPAPAPAPMPAATAKRHRLDSGGAGEEDGPSTHRRRVVLRLPPPPLPAWPSCDTERCQPGSGSDNGRASSLGDIDTVFKDCLRMSPLDKAEAAFLPKPSPGLQVPLPLLTGSTPSLAGPALPPPAGADLSVGMQASLAALEAESQAARLAHAKQEQSDKSTAGTYQRHVNRYEKWWEGYQLEKMEAILGWTTIPAFPITVAKVTMFLDYESTREKVCLPSPLIAPSAEQGVPYRKRQGAIAPYPTRTLARRQSRRQYRPLSTGGPTMPTCTPTFPRHR